MMNQAHFLDTLAISNDAADSEADRQIGRAMIAHFRQELAFLTDVEECGRRLSHVVSRSRRTTRERAATPEDVGVTVTPEDPADQEAWRRDQDRLQARFAPLAAERQRVALAMQALAQRHQAEPTLRRLAPLFETAVRNELLGLRHLLHERLHQIHCIMLGNQVTLAYTLDFYHRLLAGITGDVATSQSYNAQGQLPQPSLGPLVQQQC